MKIMKVFATIFIIIVVLVVGVLGYAGIIPGVSAVFGANKPRDLGVPHSALDLVAGQAKLKQSFVRPTAALSVSAILDSGATTVNTSLTAAEWAAHLEAIHPVKELQVKFSPDGTFEAAGRIDKIRIINVVRLFGYTKISESEVLDTTQRYFPGDAVFYLKGTGQVVNDVPTMTLTKVELGRLPFFKGSLAKALVAYAKLAVDKVPGLSIKSLTVSNSQLKLEGSTPKQLPQF